MMRFILFCFVLWNMAGCACGGGNRFTLKGHVPGMTDGTAVVRICDSVSRVLGSAKLKDGDFCIKGSLPEPGVYVLQVNDAKNEVLLEGREFVAEFTESKGARLKSLKGSSAQDCWASYEAFIMKRLEQWQEENLKTPEDFLSVNVIIKKMQANFDWTCEFIAEHPDNVASAFIAAKMMDGDYDKGIKMYNLLSDRVRNLEIGKSLMAKLKRVEHHAIGKGFPAIEVCTTKGDTIVLEDWKGCVTVVDFWASWCGPCREEMQYLKKLYKELKGKPVRFVSVSLDDSPKAWLRAHKEEKLEWQSVRNRRGFDRKQGICKEMDINGIPFIVVLDEKGLIAGKSLRRDTLRAKLLELLESK